MAKQETSCSMAEVYVRIKLHGFEHMSNNLSVLYGTTVIMYMYSVLPSSFQFGSTPVNP